MHFIYIEEPITLTEVKKELGHHFAGLVEGCGRSSIDIQM